MKCLLILIALALAAGSARPQSILPEALGGAALGAGLGAIIGASTGSYYRGPCGGSYYQGNGNAGQGAAIGAGVGLVAGALFGLAQQRESASQSTTYSYDYVPAPVDGYGYTPVYTAVPGPVPLAPPARASRPNYLVGGTLLGAASGALIGQGVSQKPGVGAAIGAASGLVVGAIAESATSQPAPLPAGAAPPPLSPPPVAQAAPPPPAATLAMAAPRYQIPDAPRVPDAPTF